MEFVVMCDYNRSYTGRCAMRYAKWLAEALSAACEIRLPQDEDAETLARSVADLFGQEFLQSVTFGEPKNAESAEVIYVSYTPGHKGMRRAPAGAHVLYPLQECGVRQAASKTRVLLPFGNRDSGQRPANLAIPLAKKFGTSLVLAHSTYPKAGVASKDPLVHMIESTRESKVEIEGLCRRQGVEFECALAIAPDISDYVVDAAIEYGCGLIVMAEGEVLRGSNAERVSRKTHIPILLAAKGGEA